MVDSMVWFDKGEVRFLLCTRGVAIHNQRILLFNVIGWDWWALPGGRIELNETAEQALVREMREEIGTGIEAGRLLWVVENFFKSGRAYHEVGFYFLMDIPAGSKILNSEEHTCVDGPVTLRFRWFPLTELEDVNLRPVFLKKALLKIPAQTKHVVWRD